MNVIESIIFRLAAYSMIAGSTYYSASFIQTLFHRLFGHTRRIGKIYEVHVGGHHAQYSGERMQSDRWIATERHITWYYAIPFIPMVLTAWSFLPLDFFVVHIGSLMLTIWWHIYLHRQYHLRESWFSRFNWFRQKQRLHFLHHWHPRTNYAIVEYKWDRLLGTFADSVRFGIDLERQEAKGVKSSSD